MQGCGLQERKLFDEKFIKLDTNRLCELTSAADSLELKQLVELTSKALARMIEGKSPEEIRETFHLPDDLTEVRIHLNSPIAIAVLSFSWSASATVTFSTLASASPRTSQQGWIK